jgi:purine operon repressor
VASRIGKLLAGIFSPTKPDQVLTLETKGIPLALFTSYYLNCPLLVARRSHRAAEGPYLCVNYLTGSGSRTETMYLPRRSIAQGSKILIIDDFMRAGGSVLGMTQLVCEFAARVVGTGILLATIEPKRKLVDEYSALLALGADRINVIWGDKHD